MLPLRAKSFILERTPFGRSSFPFGVDLRSKAAHMQENKQEVTDIISLVQDDGKSTKSIKSLKLTMRFE